MNRLISLLSFNFDQGSILCYFLKYLIQGKLTFVVLVPDRYPENCHELGVRKSFIIKIYIKIILCQSFKTFQLSFLQGNPFTVKAGDLSFSVALYTITAITGIAILMARRYLPFMGKAELGGPTFYRWLTFTLLIGMWLMYVLLSALQVYGHITSPF